MSLNSIKLAGVVILFFTFTVASAIKDKGPFIAKKAPSARALVRLTCQLPANPIKCDAVTVGVAWAGFQQFKNFQEQCFVTRFVDAFMGKPPKRSGYRLSLTPPPSPAQPPVFGSFRASVSGRRVAVRQGTNN